MTQRNPIDYRDASPQVRAIFDDIKHTRGVEDVNNFWKYLAHDPPTLARTWSQPASFAPASYVLLERYASREALAAHRATPHFQEILLSQIVPLLAHRTIEEYDVPA